MFLAEIGKKEVAIFCYFTKLSTLVASYELSNDAIDLS